MHYLWWICSTVYKLLFKLQYWLHADRLPALFHMILTRNSDFCPTQHFLVGLSNGNCVCLLWDRSWFYMAVPIATMCPLPVTALSTDWLPPPGCKSHQQMQSSWRGFKPQKAIQHTFFYSALNQDGTSVLLSKMPFIVTGFPYHKPSDAVSVHVWLKGPRDFDLSFMQVSALSPLFGLLVWLPW